MNVVIYKEFQLRLIDCRETLYIKNRYVWREAYLPV